MSPGIDVFKNSAQVVDLNWHASDDKDAVSRGSVYVTPGIANDPLDASPEGMTFEAKNGVKVTFGEAPLTPEEIQSGVRPHFGVGSPVVAKLGPDRSAEFVYVRFGELQPINKDAKELAHGDKPVRNVELPGFVLHAGNVLEGYLDVDLTFPAAPDSGDNALQESSVQVTLPADRPATVTQAFAREGESRWTGYLHTELKPGATTEPKCVQTVLHGRDGSGLLTSVRSDGSLHVQTTLPPGERGMSELLPPTYGYLRCDR